MGLGDQIEQWKAIENVSILVWLKLFLTGLYKAWQTVEKKKGIDEHKELRVMLMATSKVIVALTFGALLVE